MNTEKTSAKKSKTRFFDKNGLYFVFAGLAMVYAAIKVLPDVAGVDTVSISICLALGLASIGLGAIKTITPPW